MPPSDEDQHRTYRAGRKTMRTDEAVGRGVNGGGPKTTSWYRTVKDLIKIHGEVETANRLGVSKRTVRAWTHPDRSKRRGPNKANRAKVTAAHNTRAVREAKMTRTRRRQVEQMRRNGAKLTLTGMLGPAADKRYARFRKIAYSFPPEIAQDILDRYAEAGPEGAAQAVREALGDYFGQPGTEGYMEDLTDFQMDPTVPNWDESE